MELVMTVHVVLSKNINMIKGNKLSICMIPFTGTAEGPYFNGRIVGEGVDTQKIYPDGKMILSARYLLEGKDFCGNQCNLFIENNGEAFDKCTPFLVTDSTELQFLSEAELTAKVTSSEYGVEVNIYYNR